LCTHVPDSGQQRIGQTSRLRIANPRVPKSNSASDK
jgi:hypothetical protein